jgi:phage terminase Nu1 subunit (DNA packaging protein)
MMREMATLPGGRRKETLDRIILYLRYEAAKEKAVAPALKNDHVKEKKSQGVETVNTFIYFRLMHNLCGIPKCCNRGGI